MALLVSLVSLCVQAQYSSKVIAMEDAWNRGELHNDAAAVELLLADDFVMTVAEGTLYNKAQTLASIKDKSYHPEVLESTAYTPYGNTAVVTGNYPEKGVDKGSRGSDVAASPIPGFTGMGDGSVWPVTSA